MIRTVKQFFLSGAVIGLLSAALLAVTGADEAGHQTNTAESETLTEISLDTLPERSVDIDRLLSRGEVSFRYGRRELLGRDETDLVTNRPRVLAAETRFHLEYVYRSRTRWRVHQENDRRQLGIDVWYDSLELDFTHDVWFRDQPSTEAFWDESLVRHELDHVRISTHPMLEKMFNERIRTKARFMEAIDEETLVTESMVRSIVDNHVQSVFNAIIELVRIRYRDLDEVTHHGLRPIPPDSEPMKWTKPENFLSTD